MQYKYNSRTSRLYLRYGATTNCPFVAMARANLDLIPQSLDDNDIKEAINLSLFGGALHPKHITIERDEDGLIAYTTGCNLTEGTYRGCILHWTAT